METNRRGFLGLFGATAVAGPSAAQASLSQLLDAPVGGLAIAESAQILAPGEMRKSHASWGKKALKTLLGKSETMKNFERSRVQIHQFEPNVATLRSVSLTAKTRMSRDRLYEKSLEFERERLEGVINGWW